MSQPYVHDHDQWDIYEPGDWGNGSARLRRCRACGRVDEIDAEGNVIPDQAATDPDPWSTVRVSVPRDVLMAWAALQTRAGMNAEIKRWAWGNTNTAN